VPYAAPTKKYIPLEEFVKTIAPHFAYQLQFRNGDVEKVVKSKEDISGFLTALYGGRTTDGDVAFYAEEGVALDKLSQLRPSKLLSDEVRLMHFSPPGQCIQHANIIII
jgi:hypothetical protein